MFLVLILKEMLLNLLIGEMKERNLDILIKEGQDSYISFEEKKRDKIIWH
jgi:hypothetical protein